MKKGRTAGQWKVEDRKRKEGILRLHEGEREEDGEGEKGATLSTG